MPVKVITSLEAIPKPDMMELEDERCIEMGLTTPFSIALPAGKFNSDEVIASILVSRFLHPDKLIYILRSVDASERKKADLDLSSIPGSKSRYVFEMMDKSKQFPKLKELVDKVDELQKNSENPTLFSIFDIIESANFIDIYSTMQDVNFEIVANTLCNFLMNLEFILEKVNLTKEIIKNIEVFEENGIKYSFIEKNPQELSFNEIKRDESIDLIIFPLPDNFWKLEVVLDEDKPLEENLQLLPGKNPIDFTKGTHNNMAMVKERNNKINFKIKNIGEFNIDIPKYAKLYKIENQGKLP